MIRRMLSRPKQCLHLGIDELVDRRGVEPLTSAVQRQRRRC